MNKMANVRNSYTASRKLQVVKFAEECKKISEAARKFKVAESNVRQWINKKHVLMKQNPKKRSMNKRKPKWIGLEKNSKIGFWM